MKKLFNAALFCTVTLSFFACGNPNSKNEKQEKPTDSLAIVEKVVPTVVVTEDKVCDVPMALKSAEATHPEKKKETKKTMPAKPTATEVKQNLSAAGITPKAPVDTTFFSFSENVRSSTQTVVSFEKKGEEYLTVVSVPGNPDVIDYIKFVNKKGHTDIYGVEAGMTAKQTKELRKELKHFVKKGKVFLYSDDSNILYELDGITSEGKMVKEQDVENMNVSAIIWKDKNDKK